MHLIIHGHLNNGLQDQSLRLFLRSSVFLNRWERQWSAEELEGVYGLKIIDYHYDAPIENSFGK